MSSLWGLGGVDNLWFAVGWQGPVGPPRRYIYAVRAQAPIHELSIQDARALFLRRQRLSGPRPKATTDGILEVANATTCLQLDPINVVARPQYTIPFSRIGRYDPAILDKLCWEEKRLFSYWAHAASLVPMEQFPIHKVQMRRYSRGASKWSQQSKEWANQNAKLRRHVLLQLRKKGPLRTQDFVDHSVMGFNSGGWNEGRNVDRMLHYLWFSGKVTIAGRDGINRVWDLTERWLPAWVPTETIYEKEATRRSTVIALRSLGVATVKQIRLAFTRYRYYEMPKAMAELERSGVITPVRLTTDDGEVVPGKWYGLTEVLEAGVPQGTASRTTVLSPFDPLIADRDRARLLFGFDYTIEIYVPKAKRKYGYYVLPVLHEGRLVGRIDPKMDRATDVLHVNGAWVEPGTGSDAPEGIAAAARDLARWLGARQIAPARGIPPKVRKALAA